MNGWIDWIGMTGCEGTERKAMRDGLVIEWFDFDGWGKGRDW